MLKIAIGTKSSYKVNAIKRAIYNIDIEFESIYDSCDSGVSEQPMKSGETKQGSINRAKNILSKYPDYELGLGVEFGYEPWEDGSYHMICWATIVDKNSRIFSEHSSSLQLPKVFQNAIENNQDVDTIIDETLKNLYKNETGRKFIEYTKKRTVIYESVQNVFLRYIFDNDLY